MSTQTVRTCIRLVALLMIVSGVVGVSTTVVGAFGALVIGRTMGFDPGVGQNLGGITLYGALLWCVPCFWGVALFNVSAGLALLVTSEPQAQPDPAPSLRHGTSER